MPDPGRNGDRTEFNVVGKTGLHSRFTPHIYSGRAKYDTDVILPNQLIAKVLRSPYARAKIKSIDTSKAEALPGVVDILTWEDPDVKALGTMYWGFEAILDNQARREDDEVGVVVAAETEELCDEALKLIADTIEWEVQPHFIDPADAGEPGAPLIMPERNPESNVFLEKEVEEGDVVAGFAEADHIVEYDIKFNQMYNYLTPPTTITSYWEQLDSSDMGEDLFMTGCDMRRTVPEGTRIVFGLPQYKMHFLNTVGISCY